MLVETLITTKHEDPVPIIPNALAEMYRDHHTMVFRTAYRITGNAADAEDVLQTVFLRMVRRDDAADAIEHPENYLRRAGGSRGARSGSRQARGRGQWIWTGCLPLAVRGRTRAIFGIFSGRSCRNFPRVRRKSSRCDFSRG